MNARLDERERERRILIALKGFPIRLYAIRHRSFNSLTVSSVLILKGEKKKIEDFAKLKGESLTFFTADRAVIVRKVGFESWLGIPFN